MSGVKRAVLFLCIFVAALGVTLAQVTKDQAWRDHMGKCQLAAGTNSDQATAVKECQDALARFPVDRFDPELASTLKLLEDSYFELRRVVRETQACENAKPAYGTWLPVVREWFQGLKGSDDKLRQPVDPNAPRAAEVLGNYAGLLHKCGAYEASSKSYLEYFDMLKAINAGTDSIETAEKLTKIAETFLSVRAPLAAVPLLERSVSIFETEFTPKKAHESLGPSTYASYKKALARLADAHLAAKDYGNAHRRYSELKSELLAEEKVKIRREILAQREKWEGEYFKSLSEFSRSEHVGAPARPLSSLWFEISALVNSSPSIKSDLTACFRRVEEFRLENDRIGFDAILTMCIGILEQNPILVGAEHKKIVKDAADKRAGAKRFKEAEKDLNTLLNILYARDTKLGTKNGDIVEVRTTIAGTRKRWAQDLLASGDPEKAVEAAKQAWVELRDLKPETHEEAAAHLVLSDAMLSSGETPNDLEAMKKSVRPDLPPDDLNTAESVARGLVSHGKLSAAAEILERLVAIREKAASPPGSKEASALTCYQLGQVYFLLGEKEKARKNYRKAIDGLEERRPSDAEEIRGRLTQIERLAVIDPRRKPQTAR